jgi:hypothetical protein
MVTASGRRGALAAARPPREAAMRRTLRSAEIALAILSLAAPSTAQSDPPLPTDVEVGKFVAIWDALAADPASAAETCGLAAGETAEEEGWSATDAGEALEASPSFGPLLRRNGIGGARFAEVSLHLFGGLLGLAYADELDATARERGLPAKNRETVIRDSPAAKLAAKHEAALKPVMRRVEAVCSAAEEDDGVEDEGE